MAKANQVSTNSLSTARPVLTGDGRVDQALWVLSSILADIANQSHPSNNGGETDKKKQISQRANKKNTSLINEANYV